MNKRDRQKLKNVILREIRNGSNPDFVFGMMILFESTVPDHKEPDFWESYRMLKSIERRFNQSYPEYQRVIE